MFNQKQHYIKVAEHQTAHVLVFPALKGPQAGGKAETRGPGGKGTPVWASGLASALQV